MKKIKHRPKPDLSADPADIDRMVRIQRDREVKGNAESVFNWWISGKTFKKFYTDEVLQHKIEYTNE